MSVPAPAPPSVAPAPAPAPAPAERDTRATGLRAAAGLVAGFAMLAAVNAGVIALSIPRPESLALRVAHHAFDAAETLGIGLILGAVVGAFSAVARLPAWGFGLVYVAATAPLLQDAIGDVLHRQVIGAALVFAASFAIAIAHLAGAYVSRFPHLRPIALALALLGLVANHRLVPDDYLSEHCALAWMTLTFGGAAIAPLAERVLVALAARRAGRGAIAAAVAVALLGVVVPPSNAVRCELFRQPCALAPLILATAVWRAPHPRAPVAAPASPWFRDRSGDAPRPPTPGTPFAESPVVVLITIDATRAEAVNDPKNDVLFPTFARMKERGAWFTNAISPGAQTATALTTVFSGRYFSELAWEMYGRGASRFLYAAADPAPRFPALLTRAGVATVSFCSVNFLAGEYGVARGFQEERVIPEGRRHAHAKQVIDPVLGLLRRHGGGPLFVYAHLMEPHTPYDRGSRKGAAYERYISEIAVADAEIGRVARVLDARLEGRGVLIVSSDHGEAFGEHETWDHGKTVYEELLRVPLLVSGAGVSPRRIDERVGLIDVGPTILDIFGSPTPATFGGESLVPILMGERAAVDRPLLAEGRLRRAFYTPSGLKVISDERRKVVEVYDLLRDPAETRNLFDVDRDRSDQALGALEAFFAAHTLKKPWYRPPYRP